MSQLELKHIRKSFGKTLVLPDFNLEVPKGKILGLVGESGCGKTTALRLIAGLEQPEKGSIHLGGKDITRITPEKRRIGMVFQDLALFPHMTVEGNIQFALRKADRARTAQLLEMTGLTGLEKRYPHEISGGQQQRVALARTLANDPEVLLLDEPFSSLDERTREKIRAEIHLLIKSLGITTILVTHHAIDSFVMADQLAIMRNGEILKKGRPAEIYQHPDREYTAVFLGSSVLLSARKVNDTSETPFGTLNFSLSRDESDLFMRPENIQIGQSSKGKNTLSGQVIDKLFKGPHEVLVIQNQKGDHQLLLETEHNDFSPGDPIYLHPQMDKIEEIKRN